MFAFQDSRGRVELAFTDRHGGVSRPPYESLNLAASSGDEPAAVEENLDLVAHAFARGSQPRPGENPFTLPAGTPTPLLVPMSQVHGAEVYVVDETHVAAPRDRPGVVADAMVTAVPGVALMVRAADCVPLVLADSDREVVGVAHAGRPGMVAGVVPNVVAALRDLGAGDLTAWIGPHVCGGCYEGPAALRQEVAGVVPESFAQTSWGTPAVDIGAGVRAQLERDDVHVVDASRCTIEDDQLFSYRRQGKASGRLGGLVWVRP